MDDQERLNLNENKQNSSQPVPQNGEHADQTKKLNEQNVTLTNETNNASSKKKKSCLSSNNDDSSILNKNKYKTKDLNVNTDLKSFDNNNGNNIQLKNLSKKEGDGVDANQVKINLIDNTNNTNNNSNLNNLDVKILSNSKSSLSQHNRKKLCEFNWSKINAKTLKRPLPCLFAWTLLIGATGCYYALVSTQLLNILDDFFLWSGIIGLQSIIFLYVVINFLIAIFRDPGRFQKIIISPDDPNFNDDTKSPLHKTVTIIKTQVKIKWCSVSVFFLAQVKLHLKQQLPYIFKS